jgi:hypothetical protein
MHQWQPTGGDQTLDSAQGNTELLGGVAFGYEQSSRHGRCIGRAPRIEHRYVVTRPYAIGQEGNQILDLRRYSSTFRAKLALISR